METVRAFHAVTPIHNPEDFCPALTTTTTTTTTTTITTTTTRTTATVETPDTDDIPEFVQSVLTRLECSAGNGEAEISRTNAEPFIDLFLNSSREGEAARLLSEQKSSAR